MVIESTGKFRTRDTAGAHLSRGVTKVLISAPGKDVDATIVLGVNDDSYDPAKHHVISNASCTTNCVAPMVKVLHDALRHRAGLHDDRARLHQRPERPRRARTRTRAGPGPRRSTSSRPRPGAARAVGVVLPAMAGRLDGVSLRVPVVDGSLVDLTVVLEREVTAADGQRRLRGGRRPTARWPGSLRYTDEPIVSSDVIGDPASCVFDSSLTQADGPVRQGVRLVRQRMGLHRPPRRPDPTRCRRLR